VLAAVAGCGGDSGPARPTRAPAPHAAVSPPASRAALPHPLKCPPTSPPGCRSARGTIVYVERVDPDGDGDAHFVLAGRHGVTGPGISVIDVEKPMRPHPLPVIGDLVSAAGPVYPGSHGQRQIQATELHVAKIRANR
jgi:hypothetical protein